MAWGGPLQMQMDTSTFLALSHVADGHRQGTMHITGSIPRVVQRTMFSIRNGVACRRKGPKFGTLMSTTL